MSENNYSTPQIASSALDLVGNTPLLALDRIMPGPGRILAKCEFMNPGGSIKDRSSLGMITRARESGLLKEGVSILEVTSGNQGCGLAMVAAVMGHPITTVMSKGNSPHRATMMRALGANAILVDQVEGKPGNVTFADVSAAEKKGLELVEETGAYYVDQFNNNNNIYSHETTTGPEIWKQTGGHLDAFLATVGTAGTFIGVSGYLKKANPEIRCIAVEPKGAEPISSHFICSKGPGTVKFQGCSNLMYWTRPLMLLIKSLWSTRNCLARRKCYTWDTPAEQMLQQQ